MVACVTQHGNKNRRWNRSWTGPGKRTNTHYPTALIKLAADTVSSSVKLDSFSFNNSLAGVIYKSGPEPQLPDASVVTMATAGAQKRLAELFAVEDMDAVLDAGLRPSRGLPPQREMLWRLDQLQDSVARLGEEHPELAAHSNEVNSILLDEMKNQTMLKMNLDALLAG